MHIQIHHESARRVTDLCDGQRQVTSASFRGFEDSITAGLQFDFALGLMCLESENHCWMQSVRHLRTLDLHYYVIETNLPISSNVTLDCFQYFWSRKGIRSSQEFHKLSVY